MLQLTPEERSCWLTLLCYGSVNDSGVVTFLSEEQLMMQSGLDFRDDNWERTVGVLKKFEKLEMITNDNEVVTLSNWTKRQGEALTTYERLKKYREKKKEVKRVITKPKREMITIEENRIEENRKNTIASATPPLPFSFDKYLEAMHSHKNRHVQIIAFYFQEKKLKFDNKPQVETAIRRHLRAAKSLVPFSDAQLVEASKKAAKEYPEYTLETLAKILTR